MLSPNTTGGANAATRASFMRSSIKRFRSIWRRLTDGVGSDVGVWVGIAVGALNGVDVDTGVGVLLGAGVWVGQAVGARNGASVDTTVGVLGGV